MACIPGRFLRLTWEVLLRVAIVGSHWLALVRTQIGGQSGGRQPALGPSGDLPTTLRQSPSVTRRRQFRVEHLFYDSQHGEQSSVPSGVASEPRDAPLLGAADGSGAWAVAGVDPGVATDQLRWLGGSRGLRTGSPRGTLRRGLVRRLPLATYRRVAKRGYARGGTPGQQPRVGVIGVGLAGFVVGCGYPQNVLSALLPGVREFRTPLVTGALWVACAWILLGAKIADSKSTVAFVHGVHLDGLPATVWWGAAALLVYLIGSLLVVRQSPMNSFVVWRIRVRGAAIISRLDEEREPKRIRYRMLWKLWRRYGVRKPLVWFRILGPNDDGGMGSIIDGWLRNEFQILVADGRVPVMHSFYGGCNSPRGFRAFCSTKSVLSYPDWMDGANPLDLLSTSFADEVKREQSAIEVRIQMRFPEVYAEIDRLRVEGELRMSIFWPLLILSMLLTFTWTPLAVALLVVPPLLLRDGFNRMREASEKTWGALMSREVSSPVLDAMEGAKSEECRNFREMSGSPEPPVVMAADQRPVADLSGLTD